MGELKIRIFFCFIAIISLAVTGFAEEIDHQDAFNQIFKRVKTDIFGQESTRALQNAQAVSCALMPLEDIVVIAWKIENPGNQTVTINSEDIAFYSGNRKFKRASPDQAIDAVYNWSTSASTNRAEMREDLRGSPGEGLKEYVVRASAFEFGSSSDSPIDGVTYFACRMRNLDSVTAEIKVNGEVLKFTFDGGGP